MRWTAGRTVRQAPPPLSLPLSFFPDYPSSSPLSLPFPPHSLPLLLPFSPPPPPLLPFSSSPHHIPSLPFSPDPFNLLSHPPPNLPPPTSIPPSLPYPPRFLPNPPLFSSLLPLSPFSSQPPPSSLSLSPHRPPPTGALLRPLPITRAWPFQGLQDLVGSGSCVSGPRFPIFLGQDAPRLGAGPIRLRHARPPPARHAVLGSQQSRRPRLPAELRARGRRRPSLAPQSACPPGEPASARPPRRPRRPAIRSRARASRRAVCEQLPPSPPPPLRAPIPRSRDRCGSLQ